MKKSKITKYIYFRFKNENLLPFQEFYVKDSNSWLLNMSMIHWSRMSVIVVYLDEKKEKALTKEGKIKCV